MPATYTYNDALEDAKSAAMRAWEDKFSADEPERFMKIILDIVGRIDELKRPSRRKRKAAPPPKE